MEKQTLYRKNVNSMGYWSIWGEGDVIHIEHSTTMGGSPVRHTENVSIGKQGRSVAEQVRMRIESRISRMLDKGYKRTVELAASSSNTNQLGFLRPMLAQKIRDVRNVPWERSVLQKKLNGHRCMITRIGDEIVPYSRLGKPIPAVKHIIRALAGRIQEGDTIDGELYHHLTPLQTIASWVKAEQPNTSHVSFVAYDMVSNESYEDRYEELRGIVQGAETDAPGKVLILPHEPAVDLDHAIRRRDEVIAKGFEGMMVRVNGCPYQVGVRSNSLIKVKKFEDAEFVVVDIVLSDKGRPVCVCMLPNGKTFKTSPPGSMPEKEESLRNKHLYIGRSLTVEYAELTEDEIPFHCSATGWRVDL